MKEHNPIQTREAWVLCFLLGIIMLNFPFVHIFNKDAMIFGIPLLFLYFILGWPSSILIIYLFCRNMEDEEVRRNDNGESNRKDLQ